MKFKCSNCGIVLDGEPPTHPGPQMLSEGCLKAELRAWKLVGILCKYEGCTHVKKMGSVYEGCTEHHAELKAAAFGKLYGKPCGSDWHLGGVVQGGDFVEGSLTEHQTYSGGPVTWEASPKDATFKVAGKGTFFGLDWAKTQNEVEKIIQGGTVTGRISVKNPPVSVHLSQTQSFTFEFDLPGPSVTLNAVYVDAVPVQGFQVIYYPHKLSVKLVVPIGKMIAVSFHFSDGKIFIHQIAIHG